MGRSGPATAAAGPRSRRAAGSGGGAPPPPRTPRAGRPCVTVVSAAPCPRRAVVREPWGCPRARCLFKVDVRPKTRLTKSTPRELPNVRVQGSSAIKKHPDAVPEQAPASPGRRTRQFVCLVPCGLPKTRRETSMAEEEAAPDAADAATVEEPPKPPPGEDDEGHA